MTVTRFDANQPGDRPAVQLSKETAVALVAGLLVVVGGALQFESVSVASGAGVLIVGAILAGAGFLIAGCGDAKKWIIFAALAVTVLCILNVVSAEHSIDQRRTQIENLYGP